MGRDAAGIYFGVALLLLVRFFVGLVFGQRLMRASLEIDEPRVSLRLASRAYASGLPSAPRAAESEFISVPLTLGVLRSTILLPAGWREWDDAKLDAVVSHEVSHVARRDALTQRLSLLHRAIFWFSPLAWWLARRLADLAEQASDEAALTCGADRKDYARTLLGFFEALQAAPGRVWWQGVAMAKAGQAEKRVERILSWKGSVAMRLKKSIALVVAVYRRKCCEKNIRKSLDIRDRIYDIKKGPRRIRPLLQQFLRRPRSGPSTAGFRRPEDSRTNPEGAP